jgi:flagellar biosynthesis protein FliR
MEHMECKGQHVAVWGVVLSLCPPHSADQICKPMLIQSMFGFAVAGIHVCRLSSFFLTNHIFDWLMVDQSLKRFLAIILSFNAYRLLDEPPGLTFKNYTFCLYRIWVF